MSLKFVIWERLNSCIVSAFLHPYKVPNKPEKFLCLVKYSFFFCNFQLDIVQTCLAKKMVQIKDQTACFVAQSYIVATKATIVVEGVISGLNITLSLSIIKERNTNVY